jgi:hypothetical protein
MEKTLYTKSDNQLARSNPEENDKSEVAKANVYDDDRYYSLFSTHLGYFGRQISVDASEPYVQQNDFCRYGCYGETITEIERKIDPDAKPYTSRPDDFFRRFVLFHRNDPTHRLTIFANTCISAETEPSAKRVCK